MHVPTTKPSLVVAFSFFYMALTPAWTGGHQRAAILYARASIDSCAAAGSPHACSCHPMVTKPAREDAECLNLLAAWRLINHFVFHSQAHLAGSEVRSRGYISHASETRSEVWPCKASHLIRLHCNNAQLILLSRPSFIQGQQPAYKITNK